MSLGTRGPLYDREWLIADRATGKFLTQRECPTLSQVGVTLKEAELRIAIPGQSELFVPLEHHPASDVRVQVWSDDCRAYEPSTAVSHAFSSYLGREAALLRMAADFKRPFPEKYGHANVHTGFADQAPLLLAARESLADLNSRLEKPVAMNRFRPNVVIAGASAYAEDGWRRVSIGEIEFDLYKRCARCVIVNTEQETATRSPEVLKTLAGYRREGNAVYFAQNMIHLSTGAIKVGDALTVHDSRRP